MGDFNLHYPLVLLNCPDSPLAFVDFSMCSSTHVKYRLTTAAANDNDEDSDKTTN